MTAFVDKGPDTELSEDGTLYYKDMLDVLQNNLKHIIERLAILEERIGAIDDLLSI